MKDLLLGDDLFNNNNSSLNFTINNNTTNTYQGGIYGRWMVGLVLYILSFLTTVGNGLVLHAIRTERKLQTVSNMFIMSLAIADLTVGIVVIPISATAFIMGPEWHFGRAVCQVFLSIDYTASTASIFNLFILSLDRYWSITSPLRYLRRRTKKRALVMIGLAWIASAFWFLPILGWHHLLYSGARQTTEDECETEFVGSVPFKVISAIFNFHIPSGCMVVLYVRIFLAIKRRSVEMGRIANSGYQPSNGYSNNNVDEENDSYTEANPGSDHRGEGLKNKQPRSYISNNDKRVSVTKNGDYCFVTEFSNLTLVSVSARNPYKQSMVISHRDISPVSKYDGVKVSVQYVESSQVPHQNSDEMEGANNIVPPQQYLDVGSQYQYLKPGGGEYKNSVNRNSRSLGYKNSVATNNRDIGPKISVASNSRDLETILSVNPSTCHSFRNSLGSRKSSVSRASSLANICTRFCLKNIFYRRKSSQPTAQTKLAKQVAQNKRRKNKKRKNGGRRKKSKLQGPSGLIREKKAATQLGVILGAFISCWLPYFTLFMIVAYCDSHKSQCSVPPLLFQTSIWCGYLNSTLNPILYPLCNSNFKLAFKRILTGKKN